VGAGVAFLLLAGIIVVFSLTQKRRKHKPISSVEAADGSVNPPPLKIEVPDQTKVETPNGEPNSRADGSTIYISSPSAEAEAI
jgi:hypothetical protein